MNLWNNRGEAGPGDGDGNGDGNNQPAGDMVAKADLDAAVARADKMEQDLENMRLEVLSDDYMAFLDDKDGKGKAGEGNKKPVDAGNNLADDAFEKMSKKEIFDHAVKTAMDKIQGNINEDKAQAQNASAAKTKRLVKSFAETHEDFATYKPIMYGMSLDPKHADASLAQLYEAAKAHVKRIHAGPTEEEKNKSAKAGAGVKPGGDSGSYSKADKGKSVEQLTNEAMAEVEDSLGPIPLA